MRETGPAGAIITPSRLPADRRDAAALTLEARGPAPRRAYRATLGRLEEILAGRALTDATLAGHVVAIVADGLAPASIAQVVAAACFFAKAAGWPSPRGSMTGAALRIAHRDRGRSRWTDSAFGPRWSRLRADCARRQHDRSHAVGWLEDIPHDRALRRRSHRRAGLGREVSPGLIGG